VEASPVDWSSELATWADGSATAGWTNGAVSLSATSLVSITAIVRSEPGATLGAVVGQRDSVAPNKGWVLYISGATGVASLLADGGAASSTITGATNTTAGIHCITALADATGASRGRIYLNGTDDTNASDLSAAAGFMATAPIRIHGWANSSSYASSHGVIRVRIDDGVAITLAQHRALCGSWGLPVKSSHRVANDMTWTQSGGARCYPKSATGATCYPGGAPAATWDASGWEWAVDGRSGINRLLYSTAMDCTNWGCVGVASGTPGQVAPDGSATASTIVVAGGANHFEQDIASGYTADASPLHLTMWAKCSTGVFHPHGSNDGTRGDWDVSCTCIGGVWRHLDADDACVTVNTPFNAGSSGEAGLHFDGTLFPISADIWAPTLTEEPTTGAVIPTAAAAVSTGSIAWSIDNSSSRYWLSTSTVIESVSTVAGTCIVPGSTFWLGGSTGLECVGGVESVQVRR
jgi:hypothetical protein